MLPTSARAVPRVRGVDDSCHASDASSGGSGGYGGQPMYGQAPSGGYGGQQGYDYGAQCASSTSPNVLRLIAVADGGYGAQAYPQQAYAQQGYGSGFGGYDQSQGGCASGISRRVD